MVCRNAPQTDITLSSTSAVCVSCPLWQYKQRKRCRWTHCMPFQLARLLGVTVGTNCRSTCWQVPIFLPWLSTWQPSLSANILHFINCLVNPIYSSSLHATTFETSFQSVIATRRSMRVGVAPGALLSATCPQLPSASSFLFADDMTVIVISCQSTLPVFYLQAYPAASNTGYGTGEVSSTSLRAPRCSLRPRDGPKSPSHWRCLGNNSSALVELIIGTKSWSGWLVDLRSKGGRPQTWHARSFHC
jgi:hypothetical protein